MSAEGYSPFPRLVNDFFVHRVDDMSMPLDSFRGHCPACRGIGGADGQAAPRVTKDKEYRGPAPWDGVDAIFRW